MDNRRSLLTAGMAAAGALAAGPFAGPSPAQAAAANGLSPRQAVLAAADVVDLWRASEEQIAMLRLALRRATSRRLRALAAQGLRDELAARPGLDRLVRVLGLTLPRSDPGAAALVEATLNAVGGVRPASGDHAPWGEEADPALLPAAFGVGRHAPGAEDGRLHEAAELMTLFEQTWMRLEEARLRVSNMVLSNDQAVIQQRLADAQRRQADGGSSAFLMQQQQQIAILTALQGANSAILSAQRRLLTNVTRGLGGS
jgi:hypothetical protein